MSRVIMAAVLIVVVVGIALVLRRRQPEAPTQKRWSIPSQLDRADFAQPEVPWLVVVFTSATCNACAEVLAKAEVLGSASVVVVDAEFTRHRQLHERYKIDSVPTLVVADGQGVVRASFVGPVTATDLWATLAELREPGVLDDADCDHGQPDPHGRTT